MSYCPKCRYNFVDEIKVCPDCKEKLVERISENQDVEQDWISLQKLNSSIMADMLKEALEENEIVCLEKNDMFHSAFAIEATSMAGGEIEIFVPKDKIEKSKNILEQINTRIAE